MQSETLGGRSMQRVDYDVIAPAFDWRYQHGDYPGTRALLHRFVDMPSRGVVIEIGCGTGHWLAELRNHAPFLVGLDLSWEMLLNARISVPSVPLVRGDAVHLPFVTASADRL